MDIQGKTVLVTGGAKRIGRQLVLDLAAAGGRVALHYHQSAAAAKETQQEALNRGGVVEFFQADLREKEGIGEMMRHVSETLGPITILINSASVFYRTPFAEIQEKDWEENWKVHLLAPFWLARYAAETMKKGGMGKIINIVDRTFFRTYRHYLPYVVTKSALAAMTQTLALELAPEIQVNAIAPGLVQWPEGTGEEEKRRYLAKVPLGRPGTPEDMVRAVRALIEMDFVTGAILPLDGGISL